MALLWLESFDDDLDSAAASAQKGWVWITGVPVTGTGRWQGKSLQAPASAGTARMQTPNLGNFGTGIVGFNFLWQTFAGSPTEVPIATFFNGATEQISLYVLGTSGKVQFRVKRGSTVLGTTTNSWTSGYWLHLEFKVVFDTTGSNGSVELKVNQTSELLVENTDTTNDASTVANIFEVGITRVSGQGLQNIDDLYVLDGTGGSLNTFLGERSVEGKLPDAAGNRNQWTVNTGAGAHYTYVDESIINDDTDYLYVPNTSDGLAELFGFQNLTAIPSVVNAVILYWDLRMDTNGSDKVRPIFRNGGGTEATGAEVTIDEDQAYKRFSEKFVQDPTISGAWTPSNFNAMQMGLESRAV